MPPTPDTGEALSGSAEGTRPRWGAGTRGGTHGYLPRGLDAFDEAEEDNNPRDAQAPQEGQPHIAQVPNVIRQVQHVVPAQGQPVSARPTTPSSPTPHPHRWYLQYSSLGLVRFWVVLRRRVRLRAARLEMFPSSTPMQSSVFQLLLQYVQGSTRVMDTKK